MTVPEQMARTSSAGLALIARGRGPNTHAHQAAVRELELRADLLDEFVPADWRDYARQYGPREAIERARVRTPQAARS